MKVPRYRDVIKKNSRFFSDKRTAVIPNGVDLDVYKPAEKECPQVSTSVCKAAFQKPKDRTTLIDAFARVLQSMTDSTANLYIAGDGFSEGSTGETGKGS
ncbi:MAG: hypothetical protein IPL54_03170 [Chitinophagaceae bacterium]|nr:hypothetical protein [Chitinophagaceae bacterium]